MTTDVDNNAGTLELEQIVVKGTQRDTSSTTTVSGNTSMDKCLNRASWLIFDVYDQQYDEMGAQTRPMLADARKNWTKIFDSQDDYSGYRAVFYRPNGSDGERATLCPPVLVFRGSDLSEEELSGLAVSIEIDYQWDSEYLSSNVEDKSLQRFEHVFSADPEAAQTKPSELAKLGFVPTPIVKNDTGNIALRTNAPVIYPTPSTSVPQFPSPSTVLWSPVSGSAKWSASITIWTKDKGDWATNFRQGIGLQTTQYDRLAVRDTRRAAEIAMNEWDGRMMILGHSLGGGLASLAACVAQKENPTLKLGARTFNAAGLHSATAKRANTSLSAATIRSFAVEDEILTTLQKKSCPIPLVSHILRWAGRTMPEAITGHAFERRLPGTNDLWPVSPEEFPILTNAERIAGSCATLSDFAKRFADSIWSDNSIKILWNLYSLDGERASLSALAEKSVRLHLMPDVAYTYPDRLERYLPAARYSK